MQRPKRARKSTKLHLNVKNVREKCEMAHWPMGHRNAALINLWWTCFRDAQAAETFGFATFDDRLSGPGHRFGPNALAEPVVGWAHRYPRYPPVAPEGLPWSNPPVLISVVYCTLSIKPLEFCNKPQISIPDINLEWFIFIPPIRLDINLYGNQWYCSGYWKLQYWYQWYQVSYHNTHHWSINTHNLIVFILF